MTFIVFFWLKKTENKDINRISKKIAIKNCNKDRYFLSEKKLILDNRKIYIYCNNDKYEMKIDKFIKVNLLNEYILIFSTKSFGYKKKLIIPRNIFKNEEEPLLIELPEYKLPSLRNLLNQLYEKSKSFIIKAGTLIFAMSIVLWFLSNFNFTGMTDVNNSILSSIGGFIAPIFKPLGLGNWQASVSLLTGLIAKETVVSSMGVIFGGNLQTLLPLHFTALSALSFMVFVLLYTPCITVVGTMKKEFGTKMTLFSVAYQLILAWIVSFLVFNIGSLFF